MKKDFLDIPAYVTSEELEKYFTKFINYYKNCCYNNLDEVLEELEELAEAQWLTYNTISEDLKNKLESYLFKIIDSEPYRIMNSIETMDLIFVIIGRLGLENIYLWIMENKKYIKNIEVIKDIEEIEEEYGESYTDPYAHYWG